MYLQTIAGLSDVQLLLPGRFALLELTSSAQLLYKTGISSAHLKRAFIFLHLAAGIITSLSESRCLPNTLRKVGRNPLLAFRRELLQQGRRVHARVGEQRFGSRHYPGHRLPLQRIALERLRDHDKHLACLPDHCGVLPVIRNQYFFLVNAFCLPTKGTHWSINSA
ncbi:hypothetical protein BN1708_009544, partial [Verticillium longisporum]